MQSQWHLPLLHYTWLDRQHGGVGHEDLRRNCCSRGSHRSQPPYSTMLCTLFDLRSAHRLEWSNQSKERHTARGTTPLWQISNGGASRHSGVPTATSSSKFWTSGTASARPTTARRAIKRMLTIVDGWFRVFVKRRVPALRRPGPPRSTYPHLHSQKPAAFPFLTTTPLRRSRDGLQRHGRRGACWNAAIGSVTDAAWRSERYMGEARSKA